MREIHEQQTETERHKVFQQIIFGVAVLHFKRKRSGGTVHREHGNQREEQNGQPDEFVAACFAEDVFDLLHGKSPWALVLSEFEMFDKKQHGLESDVFSLTSV